MPNWCENTLLIKADNKNKESVKDMKRLKSLLNETLQYYDDGAAHGLLGSIISMPKALEGTTAPSDKPNWYDWCHRNWGTKWDVDLDVMTMDEYRMEFEFNSAWAPPVPWLEWVGKLFPNLFLCLTYDEPGMCFRGCACGIGDIVDEHEEYEYESE